MTGNELAEFLSRRVQAFHGNDDWAGTFIDNHDEIRTMTRLEAIGVPSNRAPATHGSGDSPTNDGSRHPDYLLRGRAVLTVYDAPGVTYEPKYI